MPSVPVSFRCALLLVISLAVCGAVPASSLAATYSVTKVADTADGSCNADCSLREAITAANATPGVADTINLPAGAYQFVQGTDEDANANGDLDITSDLTIIGAGHDTTSIETTDRYERLLDVFGASLDLSGVELSNGFSFNDGGAIRIVAPTKSLTLDDAWVIGNSSFAGGGGVYANVGSIHVSNSNMFNNGAATGGDIDVLGTTSGLVERTALRFGNSDNGGGAAVSSTLTFRQVTFDEDLSHGPGGALSVLGSGNVSVEFSSFTYNTSNTYLSATGNGGAISVQGGSLVISDSLFYDNVRTTPSNQHVMNTCGVETGATLTGLGFTVTDSSAGCPAGVLDHATDYVGYDIGVKDVVAAGGNDIPVPSLYFSSAAVDAAANSPRCAALTGGDQRGSSAPRELPNRCDAGAFELGAIPDAHAWLSAPLNGNVGSTASVTAYVDAQGPDGIHATTMTISLPAGSTNIAPSPDNSKRACSVTGTTVTCSFWNINIIGQGSVVISFVPGAEGTATINETLVTSGDTDATDNSASASFPVGAALFPPVTGGGTTTTGGTTGTSTGTTTGTTTGTIREMTPAPDTVAPKISTFVAPRRGLRRTTTIIHRLLRGGTVSNSVKLVLNETSKVTIQVQKTSGANIGAAKALTGVPAGTSFIAWGGKVGTKKLAKGCYRWKLTATDAANNRSTKIIRVCLA